MTTYINIHDYERGRVIHAPVPEWILADCKKYTISVGDVVLPALGLNDSSTEWMLTEQTPIQCELGDLTQDFDADAREAIADNV